jgi:hypothetical protein
MTMTTSSSTVIGWGAVATGAAGLLAAVCIFLFFGLGQPFGTLNDFFNGLLAISSAALAWMLYSGQQGQTPLLGGASLIIAVAGAVLALVGSVLALSGATGWYLAGLYLAAGGALLGLWLLTLSYSAWRADLLPHGLIVFGLISGLIMTLGLVAIPGILRGTDRQAYDFTLFNSIWWTGTLGLLVLFPIWCVLLGRIHLLQR